MPKRIDILKKNASNGDPYAMYEIASLYLTGKGVLRNIEFASKWYKKAADLGNLESILKLADLYEKRIINNRDERDAVAMYYKATELGHVDSMYVLAMHYYKGVGTKRDMEEAIKWLLQAAERRHSKAMYQLGLLYEENIVNNPDNLEQAIHWYLRALNEGCVNASEALQRLGYSEEGEISFQTSSQPERATLIEDSLEQTLQSQVVSDDPETTDSSTDESKSTDYSTDESYDESRSTQELIETPKVVVSRETQPTEIDLTQSISRRLDPFNDRIEFLEKEIVRLSKALESVESQNSLSGSQTDELLDSGQTAMQDSLEQSKVMLEQDKQELEKIENQLKELQEKFQFQLNQFRQDYEERLSDMESRKALGIIVEEEFLILKSQLQQEIERKSESIRQKRESQIKELQENQNLLMAEYKEKQEKLARKQYLLEHPNLRIFYTQLKRLLTDVFLARKILSTGLVAAETTSSVGQGLVLAGEVVVIPVLTALFKGSGRALSRRKRLRQVKKSQIYSELSTSIEDLETQMDNIATILTYRYEWQIRQLTVKSCKKLAECAVARMLKAIDQKQINPDDESGLEMQLILAVELFPAHKRRVWGSKRLKTTNPEKYKKWTDRKIFQQSGIYVSNTKSFYRAIQTNGDYCSVPELCGYQSVSQEEFIIIKNLIKQRYHGKRNRNLIIRAPKVDILDQSFQISRNQPKQESDESQKQSVEFNERINQGEVQLTKQRENLDKIEQQQNKILAEMVKLHRESAGLTLQLENVHSTITQRDEQIQTLTTENSLLHHELSSLNTEIEEQNIILEQQQKQIDQLINTMQLIMLKEIDEVPLEEDLPKQMIQKTRQEPSPTSIEEPQERNSEIISDTTTSKMARKRGGSREVALRDRIMHYEEKIRRQKNLDVNGALNATKQSSNPHVLLNQSVNPTENSSEYSDIEMSLN